MQNRIGIIGAGRVAQEHARAIQAIGARLVAVCDIDVEAAKRLAAGHPDAEATGSLDAFLRLPDLPAVVVAVPNHAHASVAAAALRAGKDVLLEKPMAVTVDECDALLETAKDAERILMLGFVCRYAPRVGAVRALIESGELGEVYHAKATMIRRRGIPGLGRWFTTRAKSGGGVLIDLGVHVIDLMMHLLGESRAARVSGACESRFGAPIDDYRYEEMWAGPPDPSGVFDVEDFACGLIRFPSGRTLELNVVWASNVPEGLYRDGMLLLGDRGGCFFDLWGEAFTLTTELDSKLADLPQAFDNSDAWNRAWNDQHRLFQEAIRSRQEPGASGVQGRAVQEIIEAMYVSSREEREVAIGSD